MTNNLFFSTVRPVKNMSSLFAIQPYLSKAPVQSSPSSSFSSGMAPS